ncbi:orexin/Hypocretin receptor type 1-like [Diabrotica undecimpunctata]|uniref:orexin/Hypocretin receptor type 1-like n=1 Tax=Diabrotica undecimpunctata TaxID=50387 RepID=UPI003B641D67
MHFRNRVNMNSNQCLVPIFLLLFFQLAKPFPDTFDNLNSSANNATTSLSKNDFKQNVQFVTTNNSNNLLEPAQIGELAYNYSNDSVGESYDDYIELMSPKSWTWVLIFCHFVVFVIGLVGNCLVCVAVYRNHTMRTVTNYFIVNLAVADFLVILFCLPPSVVWDVTSTWWFGSALCKIVLYIQSVSVTVSVLTLTFISIDRWYAICFPLKFKSTTGRAKTAIGIIWVVAMACEIPEPVYLIAKPYSNSYIYFTQCRPTWSEETDTIFIVNKMVFFYFIPLIFMSIAYLQIIRVLWKSGNAPHQAMDLAGGRHSSGGGQLNTFAMNMNTSTEGQLRSRRKAAKMLLAVVIMFAICFLPVHLLAVLRLTVRLSNSEINRAFSLISHWLCYANSAVNPIIYNFMSGKFRKEFRRAFDTCFQREVDRHYYQSGGTFYNKDSGFASRTQSRNECEIHRLNTFREQDVKLIRKGTRTSVLQVDI